TAFAGLLPGLAGAAMRAGDRRRDGGLEGVAAAARVVRGIERAAGRAGPLLVGVLVVQGHRRFRRHLLRGGAVLAGTRVRTSAQTGRSYKLTGKVVPGSIRHQGAALLFRVRDRNGTASVPVRYSGTVPDPFRDGREVIVNVHRQGSTYVGERDSLITKCPSKF